MPMSPFAAIPRPGSFGAQPGMGMGGPGMGGAMMGGGAAVSPNMNWAGAGVQDPSKMGKPPGQGGFDVNSLLPPALRPGFGGNGTVPQVPSNPANPTATPLPGGAPANAINPRHQSPFTHENQASGGQ